MSTLRSTVRLLPVLLLLALVGVPTSAQDIPIPEWIKNINPVDYILVNPDSTPALPFHLEGNPTIEATANGYEITLPDGTKETRREFLLYAQETIAGDKLLPTQAKGTTLSWQATWEVEIMVFETAEIAATMVAYRWGDTYGMDPLTDEALGDSRLFKQGVACKSGELVRYRNMIWHVRKSGVEEVKPAGGRPLVDADDYYAASNVAEHQAYKLTLVLAKRWLDKVAGPPVADLMMLSLYFDWWGLSPPRPKGPPYREMSADQQWVSALVKNKSQETIAHNVMLQFYVQYQGEAVRQKLGTPIKIANNLNPWQTASAATIWDLKGRPVESATITAECFVPDKRDPRPGNNSKSRTVSIWFAQDAQGRPFAWDQDTYSFINTGFKEQETEEMVEGMLATLLNNIQEAPDSKALLHVMMFPPSYERLKKYLDNSMGAGAGGHCYGMAATAALYFEDPSLKPVAKPVKDMSLAEASANINIYHRAQMLTVLDAVVTGWDWQPGRIQGTAGCGNAVKQQLVAGKLCTVVDFFSPSNAPPAGHSVLAYKYVDIGGKPPLVYVYDPNWPAPRVRASDAMSEISLKNTDFQCPPYMGYRNWAGGGIIGANRPLRKISLATVNAVMPGLKKMISDMVGWFKTAGKIMGVVQCPADAVFTDPAGRRVGTVGGKAINEIPGAEIRTSGEVEIYVLPAGQAYTVSVTGTGKGTASVSLLRAADANTAGVVSYQDLPIGKGTTFRGTVSAGGQLPQLTGGGQDYQPTLAGTYDVRKLPTQGVAPPPGTASPDVGDLVVCRSVVEAKPQGVADSFDQISKIYAFYKYAKLPDKTQARVSWKRDGQEFLKGEREISGTGWVWFSVSTNRAGGYAPGQYEVTITAGNQVARKSFVVGGGSSPAPAVTGESEVIFSVTSPRAAENRATKPAKFTLNRTRTITQVRTYHWNGGQGKAPGTIRLRNAAGKTYGPWPAQGEEGQGGVNNAYWNVYPNVALPAGEYNIIDSDPRTWSQNADTGQRGMCWVHALK